MDALRAWIRAALAADKRKTGKGLADALGVDPSQVTRLLKGTRKVSAEEIRTIARYLGVNPPVNIVMDDLQEEEIRLRKIPILGEVAAGAWLEVPAMSSASEAQEFLPFVPTENANDPGLFALRVRGTSLNKIAPDGALLVCVEYHHSGRDLDPGELVVVERRDPDGTFETTAKRVRRNKAGIIELWPESTDPRHQEPLRLDQASLGDGVEVFVRGRVKHVVIPV